MKKMKECAEGMEHKEYSKSNTYSSKKDKKSGGNPMKNLAKKKAR